MSKAATSTAAEAANALDDKDIWKSIVPDNNEEPKLGILMSEFENELQCTICCKMFHAPVSLHPCNHTFCSYCIHDSINKHRMNSTKTDTTCCICNCKIDIKNDKCFIPNRQIENIIKKYKEIRKPLLNALMRKDNDNNIEKDHSDDSAIDPSQDNTNQDTKQRATTRTTTSIEGKTNETTTKNKSNNNNNNKRREKYKGIFNYRKSKKELKNMCAQFGLHTTGTEEQLKRRHQEYITLYNSECDSYSPRPISELVQIIHNNEKAAKIEEKQSKQYFNFDTCLKKLYEQRKLLGENPNSTWKDVTIGVQDFDDAMKNRYIELIQQMKNRNKDSSTDTEKNNKTLNTTQKSPAVQNSKTDAASSPTNGLPAGRETANNDVISSPSSEIPTTNKSKTVLGVSDNNSNNLKNDTTLDCTNSTTTASDNANEVTSSNSSEGTDEASPDSKNVNNKIYSESSSSANNNTKFSFIDLTTNETQQGANSVNKMQNNNSSGLKRKSPLSQSQLNVVPKKSKSLISTSKSSNTPSSCDKKMKPSLIGTWSCEKCTFFNTKNRSRFAKCEICNARRPVPDQE